MNPVLRWLDDPPKFLGFSGLQWLWLILGGGSLAGLLYLLRVPIQPAGAALILLVGAPAAFVYLSEQTGVGMTQLLVDAVKWRRHPHHYDPAGAAAPAGVYVTADEPRRRALPRRAGSAPSTRAGGAQ